MALPKLNTEAIVKDLSAVAIMSGPGGRFLASIGNPRALLASALLSPGNNKALEPFMKIMAMYRSYLAAGDMIRRYIKQDEQEQGKSKSGSRSGSAPDRSTRTNKQFFDYTNGLFERLDKLIQASTTIFPKIAKNAGGVTALSPTKKDEDKNLKRDDTRKNLGSNIFAFLAGVITTAFTSDFWPKALASVAATIRFWADSFVKMVSRFWNSIKDAIKNLLKKIPNLKLPPNLAKQFGNLKSAVKGIRVPGFGKLMSALRAVGKSTPIIGALLVPALETAEKAPEIKLLGDQLDSGQITEEQYNKKVSSIVIEIGMKSVATLAGAAGGAILGQVLLPIPGLGAVVGGIIGSVAGGMLGSAAADFMAPYVIPQIQSALNSDQNIGPVVKNITKFFSGNFFKKGIEATLKELKEGKKPASVDPRVAPSEAAAAPAASPAPAPAAPAASSPSPAPAAPAASPAPAPAPAASSPSPAAPAASSSAASMDSSSSAPMMEPSVSSPAPMMEPSVSTTSEMVTPSDAGAAAVQKEILLINGTKMIDSKTPVPVKDTPKVKLTQPNVGAGYA